MMSYKDNKGFYYEFELTDDFIPHEFDKNEERRIKCKRYALMELGEFMREKFLNEGLTVDSDRIFLHTKDHKKIDEMENFCKFLMDNKILFELITVSVEPRNPAFRIASNPMFRVKPGIWSNGLEKAYEVYKLSQELGEDTEESKKKPKI